MVSRVKFVVTLLLVWCVTTATAVEVGAERIAELLPELRGKRVALIVNHTSMVGDTHLLDTLISVGVNVTQLFAPEHGFRGDADAGEVVASGRDSKTGVPIVSLYGKNKRPTQEQLSGVDVVVFDIQDVGARFYTYISTMFYAMESCAKYNRRFVVLDRPNPNDYVDGAVLSEDLKSFVGALPIPILHGVTVGELARMIVGEEWGNTKGLELSVVAMRGWRHGQPYDLPIKPSPNLPTPQSVALYPSLCLFEATQVSVGRGTLTPFEVVGYPDPEFGEYSFTPRAMEGFDKNPLQRDKTCYGLDLREVTPPKGFSLKYFIHFMQLSSSGKDFISSPSFFDKLSGDSSLRDKLAAGVSEEVIREGWQPALDKYKQIRKKYLIYPDYLLP
ncbi:MAG: DUF1343 domain-containing protein [Rikenellaceae bacterium]